MIWHPLHLESTFENPWDNVAEEDELLYQDMLDYGPDMVKLQSWFRASSIKCRDPQSHSSFDHEKRMADHEERIWKKLPVEMEKDREKTLIALRSRRKRRGY
jgi:hypothetical protein